MATKQELEEINDELQVENERLQIALRESDERATRAEQMVKASVEVQRQAAAAQEREKELMLARFQQLHEQTVSEANETISALTEDLEEAQVQLSELHRERVQEEIYRGNLEKQNAYLQSQLSALQLREATAQEELRAANRQLQLQYRSNNPADQAIEGPSFMDDHPLLSLFGALIFNRYTWGIGSLLLFLVWVITYAVNSFHAWMNPPDPLGF
ncbi:MAG TPA: hypothetical protein VF708_19740 [Pyrinomonadaceae bacterium]|jgi:hypothetical protein